MPFDIPYVTLSYGKPYNKIQSDVATKDDLWFSTSKEILYMFHIIVLMFLIPNLCFTNVTDSLPFGVSSMKIIHRDAKANVTLLFLRSLSNDLIAVCVTVNCIII